MLGICFSDHPTAEASTEWEGHLGTPLVQSLAFDHISELYRRNAKFVNWVFKLFELLIDHVHDVLLTLRRICQILVMLVFCEIIIVGKNAWFYVTWNSENAILL